MLHWQIVFFANVPVWQYGTLIQMMDTPHGQVPTLFCSSVVPVLNGFLEASISVDKMPTMTMLIRADHVLVARYSKAPQQFGFGVPQGGQPLEIPALHTGGAPMAG